MMRRLVIDLQTIRLRRMVPDRKTNRHIRACATEAHRCLRRWVFAAAVLFLTSALSGQNAVNIFGYFESQMMGADIQNTFYHIQTNKLRVDLKYSPSHHVTFLANYNGITYHGKTQWDVLDFLPDGLVSEIPESLAGFYVIPFEDQYVLDNANLRLTFSRFDLTVGKQQISLGSGYVWNPVDVFNVKDVLDPTYEQPGHNAVRLDVQLGKSFSLSALYAPEDTWSRSGKLVQLKGRIPRFDIALLAIETTWHFHDYTSFDYATYQFQDFPETRRVLGASTEGECLGLGLYAEYGYNLMERSPDFQEWVAGMNYTFDSQTFVMLEFYRNTMAKADYHDYNINDWMRFLASEQKTVARDQLYMFIQQPATDFIDIGMSGIWCVSDGSIALVPTLTWSLLENVDVMAYANVNFGAGGTAYSRLMGNGGLVRARVYF